ncbi:hypothetical protein IVA94_39370 [Bradyrhizobium sp. 156]|nr:hypothetical protein [Bradyrhizobium sp. 156]
MLLNVLMRAANDVPPVHAWSAVSTILRPPCPLVETDDRDAAVQFVPPLQVTSTVRSVLSVGDALLSNSSRTRALATLESAVCDVVTTVILLVWLV